MTPDYTGIYILLGGITLCAVIIATLDWWAQRRHDLARKQGADVRPYCSILTA